MPLGKEGSLGIEGDETSVDGGMLPREMMAKGEACRLVRDFIVHFSNPLRLRIMCELHGSESSVTDLVEATGARQPTVSQQLNLLRLAGIVARKREGNRSLYRIADPLARDMMGYIYVIAEKLLNRQGEGQTQTLESSKAC